MAQSFFGSEMARKPMPDKKKPKAKKKKAAAPNFGHRMKSHRAAKKFDKGEYDYGVPA